MKGWRTIAFNCVLAVISVLVGVNWSEYLPAEWVGVAGFFVAVANMGLRYATTTPVGRAD